MLLLNQNQMKKEKLETHFLYDAYCCNESQLSQDAGILYKGDVTGELAHLYHVTALQTCQTWRVSRVHWSLTDYLL